MVSLRDAHQQFIDNLKSKSRASATILAYGKDIAQLVDYLQDTGKTNPTEIKTEDLQAFMQKLNDMEFLIKFKSNSKLTEKDALRLGREVSSEISKRLKAK